MNGEGRLISRGSELENERSSAKIFWLVILIIGATLKFCFFQECLQKDLLALNQLRAMDMEKFLNWSRILVQENRWFSDFPTDAEASPAPQSFGSFYQAPLYPYFMAFVYFLTGTDPSFGFGQFGYHVIILVQQALGLLALFPLYSICRRFVPVKAARLLVVTFLFCDVMAFYETILLRAFLISFVYLFLIDHLLKLRDSPNWKRALSTGIWLGLAWVVKPNFMALMPFILFWLLWQKPRVVAWSRWNQQLLIMGLGFVMILAFPLTRNILLRMEAEEAVQPVEGKENPVPLLQMTTRGPYSYINGNSFRSANSSEEDDFINPGMGAGLGWNFGQLKRFWYGEFFFSESSDFSRRTLERYPGDPDWRKGVGSLLGVMKLVWAEHSERESWFTHFWPTMKNKIHGFLNGYEVPNNTNIYIYRKFSNLMNVFFVSGSLIYPLFLLGFIVLVPQWKKPEVSLLLGFVLIYLVITVFFYFIARFRAPVFPLMFVIGSIGLFRWIQLMRSGGWFARTFLMMIFIGSVWVAYPRDVRGGTYQEQYEKLKGLRYADYYNYALGKVVLKKPEESYEITQQALAVAGAYVFSPLLKIHFWSLENQKNKTEELVAFSRQLEKFYQGQWKEDAAGQKGRALFLNDLEHAALYTLALDTLIAHETVKEQRRKRELKFAYQKYGLQRLYEARYGVVYNNAIATPKHYR